MAAGDIHILPHSHDASSHAAQRATSDYASAIRDTHDDALVKTGQRAAAAATTKNHEVPSAQDGYEVPDAYANLDELAAPSPVPSPSQGGRQSLDQVRSREQGWQKESRMESPPPPPSPPPGDQSRAGNKDGTKATSQLLTQIYTLSYLVFFALMGLLARLGLTALTRYVDTPVLFTSIWANFGGSLVMGFLAEDRMLFRHEWGTPSFDHALARAKKSDEEEGGSASASRAVDVAAAKKAHLACKKTIPLYIGLTTGFCGSFTSFSTFIRDIFLAMSNDIVAPGFGTDSAASRNGGYSFMAMLAVVITTVALSLSGHVFGAHCAIATERLLPSLPYPTTRKFVDPVFVLLGWGCWLGAVLLAVFPPAGHDEWRGQVVFALVFAPLGCLARFYLALLLNGKKAAFPLGTFAANVLGTATLGMAWDLAHVQSGGIVGCQVLQGVEDGFCGCLTTISTWVAELKTLRRSSAYIYGAASVVVSLAIMVLIMGGLRWTDGWSTLKC